MWRLPVGLIFTICVQATQAEPYLAVQQGLKCIACHTSPTGGGKRNAFGNIFAQRELPARTFAGNPDKPAFWTGELWSFVAVGGDIRAGWTDIDLPGQPNTADTDLEEILAYVEIRLIPRYLDLYVDAKLGPDDPLLREQYAKLSLADGRFYLKGGEFYLPYGLRLQDDEAFIRQVSGINFNTPDSGWEIGWEQGRWSTQLAVTRGTAGGAEIDSGKQYSLLASYVRPRWRLGASLNLNDSRFGDRQMQNIFAGLRTGRVSWLAELDYIIDEASPTGRRERWVGLLEANVLLARGHNLKMTYEHFDADTDVSEDGQNRYSLVWEYSPFQFLQGRAGLRRYDGIPQNPSQNRQQLFVEVHLPF